MKPRRTGIFPSASGGFLPSWFPGFQIRTSPEFRAFRWGVCVLIRLFENTGWCRHSRIARRFSAGNCAPPKKQSPGGTEAGRSKTPADGSPQGHARRRVAKPFCRPFGTLFPRCALVPSAEALGYCQALPLFRSPMPSNRISREVWKIAAEGSRFLAVVREMVFCLWQFWQGVFGTSGRIRAFSVAFWRILAIIRQIWLENCRFLPEVLPVSVRIFSFSARLFIRTAQFLVSSERSC